MIVMKFGGTSVEDAPSIRRVTDIVRKDVHRSPVVVVSAMAGVTNELLRIAALAAEGKTAAGGRAVTKLEERHDGVAKELLGPTAAPVVASIRTLVDDLRRLVDGVAVLGEASPRSLDAIASFGERLSSLIIHEYFRRMKLESTLIDARSFMITDGQHTAALPDARRTRTALKRVLIPALDKGRVVVTQGFMAATRTGVTTTLGRGGSDLSAALIGALLKAREIQIWTDVDGILTADPSIVREARNIEAMSFREAAELAYFGARVLHPETILPAVSSNIPVIVKNSRRPDVAGTVITASATDIPGAVKSVAYKEGITLLTIVSTRMFLAHGFLERVFDVFEHHRTVVHAVASSDVSITAAINDIGRLKAITAELRSFASVTVERNKAIVCVVGEGLRNTPGIAARILGAAGEVTVNMISQGASEINLGFVLDERQIAPVVRRLHAAFFERKADKEAA